MYITGDVLITPEHITFSHRTFKIRLVREIDKVNLSDVGKILDAFQTPSNENILCGPNDAKWMLAGYGNNYLSVAFFSSDTEPKLDYQSVVVGHNLCGTFNYGTP